ncbi:unnamed protein product [Periconia digitata]|uniref:Uncharacterized protein n=1 Tax=Periconia digitata TaxID=1303443 RepID=A0A9W4UQ02_9PLEO|nr:unnamed protein product [Periconia digitata]
MAQLAFAYHTNCSISARSLHDMKSHGLFDKALDIPRNLPVLLPVIAVNIIC